MSKTGKKQPFTPIRDQQVIHFFTADKETVMANETLTLEWEVANARRVSLDHIDRSGNRFSTFVLADHQFELVAHGRYSKIKALQFVRLHKPQILLLEADLKQLEEGKTVHISFRFRYGLNWKLTASYRGLLHGKREQVAQGTVQDGYALTEQTVELLLLDICTLEFQVRNGASSSTEEISLGKRAASVRLNLDRDKVVPGSAVHLTWDTENVNELYLNPGYIELTGLSSYDLIINGERDLQLELIGKGDFGEQARDSRTVVLARINSFSTANNGDLEKPEFYLKWHTSRFWELRLLPDNVLVDNNTERYRIKPQGPDTYTLVGKTRALEEVSATIQLYNCRLEGFELMDGKAMIGSTARLRWSVTAARSLYLWFAGEPAPVKLPSPETSEHQFQVLKDCDQVKLIGWGDRNVMVLTIPIPRYTGPEIRSLNLPTIDLQLGIRWISAPLMHPQGLYGQISAVIKRKTQPRTAIPLWRLLAFPSNMARKITPAGFRRPVQALTQLLKKTKLWHRKNHPEPPVN